MLNRRLLRVKVLQAIYAFQQSDEMDLARAEKELFLSLERIYDLYLQLLVLPVELRQKAITRLEESKSKMVQTEADKQATNHFIKNRLILAIEENEVISKVCNTRKISWSADQEVVSKLFKKLKETSFYNDYLEKEETDLKEDHQFLLYLIKNVILKDDIVKQLFQERSIYWSEDEYDYACHMVRTSLAIEDFDAKFKPKLLPLFKDEEDDRKFVKDLLRTTINQSDEFEKLIAGQTKNWEVERIAVLDIIMMKMALTELTEFRSIPVKVSLNEYIEISKFFSSPKSKVFINGVLDKLIPELKKKKQIVKTGRGLMQ